MGFAQGSMLKPELEKFVYGTWDYLISEGLGSFPSDKLPTALQALVLEKGMEVALDWTVKVINERDLFRYCFPTLFTCCETMVLPRYREP
jgi:hypothetical protein